MHIATHRMVYMWNVCDAAMNSFLLTSTRLLLNELIGYKDDANNYVYELYRMCQWVVVSCVGVMLTGSAVVAFVVFPM